jgi:hypothetical protein
MRGAQVADLLFLSCGMKMERQSFLRVKTAFAVMGIVLDGDRYISDVCQNSMVARAYLRTGWQSLRWLLI